jgi:hypothetical protein
MNYSTGVLYAPEYFYAAAQGRIVLPYIHKVGRVLKVPGAGGSLAVVKHGVSAAAVPQVVCARDAGKDVGFMICLLTDDVDAVLIRFDQHCVEYHSFPPTNCLPQRREWAPLERAMEGERRSGVARQRWGCKLGAGSLGEGDLLARSTSTCVHLRPLRAADTAQMREEVSCVCDEGGGVDCGLVFLVCHLPARQAAAASVGNGRINLDYA